MNEIVYFYIKFCDFQLDAKHYRTNRKNRLLCLSEFFKWVFTGNTHSIHLYRKIVIKVDL